jgi:hypothetical protein
MRTNVYIDGFNLYYRMLKENPQFPDVIPGTAISRPVTWR